MSRTKVAFFTDIKHHFQNHERSSIDVVYGSGRREEIEELAIVYPELIGSDNFDQHSEKLADVEAIFSTWGFPVLNEEQLDKMPRLKVVFYGAGATPWRQRFFDRDIIVCSGTLANAVPVAEFCLMQIIQSLKGVFTNSIQCNNRKNMLNNRFNIGSGLYGANISLLGNGSIARHLSKLLLPFDLQVQMFDSYELHQDPKCLKRAFSEGNVVSNHLPDLGTNHGMITTQHFRSMPHGAAFINTARGQQVDESALVDVLGERSDLSAYLDVQDPEPPVSNSPLYRLPNIFLTSHVAGAYNKEFLRISDYMISDFKRWLVGDTLSFRVQPDML